MKTHNAMFDLLTEKLSILLSLEVGGQNPCAHGPHDEAAFGALREVVPRARACIPRGFHNAIERMLS